MPYLTETERKQPIRHMCQWYEFSSCADLSEGVKIKPIVDNPDFRGEKAINLIARDVAQFTAWWMISFHGKLNGFSGIDTIKWEMK